MGNGLDINIWRDAWVLNLPGFKIETVKLLNCPFNRVGDFFDRGIWKAEVIHFLFSPVEAKAIMEIPISFSGVNDKLVGHFNPNGVYSVKFGYQEFFKMHSPLEDNNIASSSFSPNEATWKAMWSLKCPPKISHFWWKVCRNALASNENLFARKCSPSLMCNICGIEKESIEHILFRCKWTKQVWRNSALGNVSPPNSIISCARCQVIMLISGI